MKRHFIPSKKKKWCLISRLSAENRKRSAEPSAVTRSTGPWNCWTFLICLWNPDYLSDALGLMDTDRLQERLKEFLQRETASLRLTEEYAQAVSLPKIRHFLEQELAYRMWRAFEQGLLYREQPFVLGIDAKRLDQDLPEGEKVLIQGIIDVFFIENGEIVLLDYKTDVIDSLQALWNRYSVQIQYYEEALTKLMQLPVKERILYSFYLEKYE